MVQVPTVKPVTVLPLTVQTPEVWELNTIVFPDAPPVAETVPVPPTIMVGATPKIMVWLPLPTVMAWVA